jgi:hypothetical protein
MQLIEKPDQLGAQFINRRHTVNASFTVAARAGLGGLHHENFLQPA